MAGITNGENGVKDVPKKRIKKIVDSVTSGASYTEISASDSENEIKMGDWEIAADRFS
jgi:phosphosulfolactate synthase (CoM biosynthesis protein A)